MRLFEVNRLLDACLFATKGQGNNGNHFSQLGSIIRFLLRMLRSFFFDIKELVHLTMVPLPDWCVTSFCVFEAVQ